MNLNIPIWWKPWQAKAAICSQELQLDELRRRVKISHENVDAERHAHSMTAQEKVAIEMELAQAKAVEDHHKKSIAALTAWIFTTHKIDQLPPSVGLVDILRK